MANKEGPFKLSGAHVVAAVAGMEHGTVARVFDVLGLDRGAVSAAAEQELHAMRTGSPGR